MTPSSFPLTPLQQGMLFHTLLSPAEGLYTQRMVMELDEPLHPDRFRAAWRELLRRHEALRVRFRWEGLATAVQEIVEDADLRITMEDWRGLDIEAREAGYLRSDREKGLSPSVAPAMRLMVARVGDDAYRCYWTSLHLVMDGRSRSIVLRELFSIYDALQDGLEPPPPAVRRPFSLHVEWLHSRNREADEAFWRESLRGVGAPTSVLGHRPDGSVAAGGERETLEAGLTRGATDRLRDLARKSGCGLATVVSGAWSLLLARHANVEDVVFGVTRSGRRSAPEGTGSTVGLVMNTVPYRVRLQGDPSVRDFLRGIRSFERQVGEHEHAAPTDFQRWSGVSPGQPLFDSAVIYDHARPTTALAREGGRWAGRRFRLLERTEFPLVLNAWGEDELLLSLRYAPDTFQREVVERALGHLVTLLEGMGDHPDRTIHDLPLLTPGEQHRLFEEWNATQREFPEGATIHGLFAEQAAREPHSPAVAFGDRHLTYAELDERSARLAERLSGCGVGPGTLVGVYMSRSEHLPVALLGVVRAGGAYVPLDPTYPKDRIDLMIQDSGMEVLVADRAHARRLNFPGQVLLVDEESSGRGGPTAAVRASGPEDLAYAMYTSGSTGRPKGVLVEHRNVVNFFHAMDERIGGRRPGTWMALTSISFDISVLELLWTLTRGFKVVIRADERLRAARAIRDDAPGTAMDFSLFYFSSDADAAPGERYRLVMEGARFADANGFRAIWTPERHFHAFGGLYPSPAIMGAALSSITRNVHLRAGSVVLPLHEPVRVAEEWALLDNLSGGRVGVAFASGWHDRDFIFRPENYEDRRSVMFRGIEEVQALWRGEKVTRTTGAGTETEVGILPRPVQPELPVWVTAAGGPDTFRRAGEIGAGILTHLLGQSPSELAEKIRIYRQAWKDAGHGPGAGHVVLMLHTFVGEDEAGVEEAVRGPFREYLRTSVDLIGGLARGRGQDIRSSSFTAADMEALLDHAVERYYETSALFGTPDHCLEVVERMQGLGVDEIACLIDFGVETDRVLDSLRLLADLADRVRSDATPPTGSVLQEVIRHEVTHLQCTPSMARMLVATEDREALRHLESLLVGGEALPSDLAGELADLVPGEVLNMYGPTETTIWSATHRVTGGEEPVPIGRPVANTTFFVLDERRRPVPVGVPGELFIGGAGVVRGYHGRSDLTEERFVPDPSGGPGGRLYRTGDLVRYRSDGVLEFLGRVDHQVKIRGHRIELGEIEAVLASLPGVAQAVAAVRGEVLEDRRIVAYALPQPGATLEPAALTGLLRNRLPEAMVPTQFLVVESFPLTPNGKVDRNALPDPNRVRSSAVSSPPSVPSTDLEQRIVGVWQEVLGVPTVGLDDNFFDLGGHSLLTVRVHNQLRETMGLEVSITDLFRFPTVRALAGSLGGSVGVSEPEPSAAVRGQDRGAQRRAALLRRSGRG